MAAVLMAVAVAVLAGGAGAAESEWLKDEGGVLELLLAHRERDRVDGGTLRIDRARRLVLWTGAPNEIGCPRPWEASFDDLDAVRAEPPGFVIVLRQGSEREQRLIPLPHFAELLAAEGRVTGVAPNVREALKGPDGDPLPLGGSGASSTPGLKRRELSAAVQRDSRRALDAILDALGRSR